MSGTTQNELTTQNQLTADNIGSSSSIEIQRVAIFCHCLTPRLQELRTALSEDTSNASFYAKGMALEQSNYTRRRIWMTWGWKNQTTPGCCSSYVNLFVVTLCDVCVCLFSCKSDYYIIVSPLDKPSCFGGKQWLWNKKKWNDPEQEKNESSGIKLTPAGTRLMTCWNISCTTGHCVVFRSFTNNKKRDFFPDFARLSNLELLGKNQRITGVIPITFVIKNFRNQFMSIIQLLKKSMLVLLFTKYYSGYACQAKGLQIQLSNPPSRQHPTHDCTTVLFWCVAYIYMKEFIFCTAGVDEIKEWSSQ